MNYSIKTYRAFDKELKRLAKRYKSLKEEPAQLLRPKAPKPGKRVFLEHIPFIWNKLKFNSKVTVRNIFRYKKKFLMTIIGISGCTGLILAGFGLKDCILNMVPNQYGKIFNYQAQLISLPHRFFLRLP